MMGIPILVRRYFCIDNTMTPWWTRWLLKYRRLDCLLNRSFRRRSNKTSRLRVTGLLWVESNFVSIWWRQRGYNPQVTHVNVDELTKVVAFFMNVSQLFGAKPLSELIRIDNSFFLRGNTQIWIKTPYHNFNSAKGTSKHHLSISIYITVSSIIMGSNVS